mmetsp:Transcript_14606/g.31886  ORF Transcript_14606/g.31886 Transcript_14606/m.31886 type:complete len:344 (-) Transcript_14606:527-1558(-)
MITENGIHTILIFGVDVVEDDGLRWADNAVNIVRVYQSSNGGFETEITFVLDASILHVKPVKELAITLFPPSHPIIVLEFVNGAPWLNGLAKVTFDKLSEIVNAQGVDQVLHTSIGTDFAISMIPLGGHDSFHELHTILQRNKTHVISSTGKSIGLVVCSAHAATNHYVETFHLTIGVSNHNQTNVICVYIKGVVSNDGDSNFEFSWQVSVGVNGFHRILCYTASSIVVVHGGVNVVLLNISGPHDRLLGRSTVQPDSIKRIGHGAEQLSHDLGPFTGGIVGCVFEGSGRAHDISADITTSSHGARSNIHDGRNNVLEVSFANAVHLEALSCGGTQISLSTIT